MVKIEYSRFDHVETEELLAILNEDSLRTHLIEHPYFDAISLRSWMEDKSEVDSMKGCRVRVVYIGGELAGWCGIQPDDNGFEIAIVLSRQFWGYGRSVFKTLLFWARDLGHGEIVFHLLESRREYKALRSMSTRVHKSTLAGRIFTTYTIAVGGV